LKKIKNEGTKIETKKTKDSILKKKKKKKWCQYIIARFCLRIFSNILYGLLLPQLNSLVQNLI
jgi:hypothetical protein